MGKMGIQFNDVGADGGLTTLATLPTDLARDLPKARMPLTRRQRQILQLICAGFRNGEIAERLGIVSRTVEHHKYTMMRRLGVRTTAELAAHAVRQNLVQ